MRSVDLAKVLGRVRLSGANVVLVLAALVGAVTALAAIGFTALIRFANHLFFGMTDEFLTHFAGGVDWQWWLPLIPMLGGLCVGPIVTFFASEAKGHGVTEVINAVARKGGIIRPRVALAKAAASAITIGSGGSAGREGPIVQIGSALGSTVGQLFRMSGDRIKVLVGCGAAAGIASIFNAPIAGVLFALEVIMGDFAIRTFSPVLISSVVASVISRAILGDHPAFNVTPYALESAWEIGIYAVMGGALGGVAVLFTRVLDWIEELFEKLKLHRLAKPALGGLLLGGVALAYPQVLADGYETITLTLNGELALSLLVPLVFLKILATSLTLGSGNSGGVFAPSLFIGAVAGGAIGFVAHWLFPNSTATPGAYALVGMAGLVAGTIHAPLTAILIIFEITNDYHIMLPLMITVTTSMLVARKLLPQSIYTLGLFKRGIEIRGGRDLNILRTHSVRDLMRTHYQTMPAATPLAEILSRLEQSDDNYFVILDPAGQFIGLLSLRDVRQVISRKSLDYLVIAQDLVSANPISVQPEENLEHVMREFSSRDLRVLPVVSDGSERRLLGIIRRDDVTDFYNRRLVEMMRQD